MLGSGQRGRAGLGVSHNRSAASESGRRGRSPAPPGACAPWCDGCECAMAGVGRPELGAIGNGAIRHRLCPSRYRVAFPPSQIRKRLWSGFTPRFLRGWGIPGALARRSARPRHRRQGCSLQYTRAPPCGAPRLQVCRPLSRGDSRVTRLPSPPRPVAIRMVGSSPLYALCDGR